MQFKQCSSFANLKEDVEIKKNSAVNFEQNNKNKKYRK